jgi:hypothetical protein
MRLLVKFTREEIEVLMDAMSYPIGSVAGSGCWHTWDYWREHQGHRYWNSASWHSFPEKQLMNRQDREMFRYLTIKGIWKC